MIKEPSKDEMKDRLYMEWRKRQYQRMEELIDELSKLQFGVIREQLDVMFAESRRLIEDFPQNEQSIHDMEEIDEVYLSVFETVRAFVGGRLSQVLERRAEVSSRFKEMKRNEIIDAMTGIVNRVAGHDCAATQRDNDVH